MAESHDALRVSLLHTLLSSRPMTDWAPVIAGHTDHRVRGGGASLRAAVDVGARAAEVVRHSSHRPARQSHAARPSAQRRARRSPRLVLDVTRSVAASIATDRRTTDAARRDRAHVHVRRVSAGLMAAGLGASLAVEGVRWRMELPDTPDHRRGLADAIDHLFDGGLSPERAARVLGRIISSTAARADSPGDAQAGEAASGRHSRRLPRADQAMDGGNSRVRRSTGINEALGRSCLETSGGPRHTNGATRPRPVRANRPSAPRRCVHARALSPARRARCTGRGAGRGAARAALFRRLSGRRCARVAARDRSQLLHDMAAARSRPSRRRFRCSSSRGASGRSAPSGFARDRTVRPCRARAHRCTRCRPSFAR